MADLTKLKITSMKTLNEVQKLSRKDMRDVMGGRKPIPPAGCRCFCYEGSVKTQNSCTSFCPDGTIPGIDSLGDNGESCGSPVH